MVLISQTDDNFNLVILKAVALVMCLRTLASLKHTIFIQFITIP